MPALDDLPKMVSLSPEPLATGDEKNVFGIKLTDPLQPTRRHNLDAEVIEALLQQDVDLGLTRHDFDPVRSPLEEVEPVPEKSARLDDEWLASKGSDDSQEEDTLDKLWAGLDYTIDSETGEYMLAAPAASSGAPQRSPMRGDRHQSGGESLLSGPIPTTIDELMGTAPAGPSQGLPCRPPSCTSVSPQSSLAESEAEIALLQMIEAASATAQPRAPLNRMVSMEQRWQDLASVLLDTPPPPAPPVSQLRHSSPPQTMLHVGGYHHQLSPDATDGAGRSLLPPPGSLCAPSLPTMEDGDSSGSGEMTYFQLSPAPVAVQNGSVASPLDQDDAFLSQLLGVDQLDLSAMPITELAPQDWSTASTQVNGGGGGGGSPSQSPPGNHSRSPPSGQFGMGAGGAASSAGAGSNMHGRSPRVPVAQKKHHMYGKRFFQAPDGAYDDSSVSSEPCPSPCRPSTSPAPPTQRYGAEGGLHAAFPPPRGTVPVQTATTPEAAEVKYSRTPQFTNMSPSEPLDAVAHNHSYHQPAPAETATEVSRPVARDKLEEKKPSERVSRDEKRLRSMEIPLSAEEIVNMPMDDFNERLAKLQLTEAQLSLVRDVRRRGKNKLAAQNCRKRKLDQITSLTEDLQKVRDERQRILAEHQFLTEMRTRIRDKYAQLHRHVFQSLRDADNQPYSPSEYSLQLSADGDVLLVPRGAARGAAIVPPAAVTAAGRHKPTLKQ